MKSRSHHPAASPAPDDWVDGSWTVDCVCGVNFDDGEEMVNCDECGVWVHTRCSRYLKSEKSFVCDKCKSKNSRNDSEEKEVAQLLVELPTKTLNMDKPLPPRNALRRPFRLWAELPMEEKVHVQGIPGGEPGLFSGMSSIITPELWKCTGYVPKKFNFQYREFPCWGKKQEDEVKSQEGKEVPMDKVAGMLFSLSEDNVSNKPVGTQVAMKRLINDRSKIMTHLEGENLDLGGRSQGSGSKNEKNLQGSLLNQYGKRKKEDTGIFSERLKKKKVGVHDEEGSFKKLLPRPTKTDSGLKAVKTCSQGIKSTILKDTSCSVVNIKNAAGSSELPSDAASLDTTTGNDISIQLKPTGNKDGQQVSARSENSQKNGDSLALSRGRKNHRSTSMKDEDIDLKYDVAKDNGKSYSLSNPTDSQKAVVKGCTTVPVTEINQSCQDSSCHKLPSAPPLCSKAERDGGADVHLNTKTSESHPMAEDTSEKSTENGKMGKTVGVLNSEPKQQMEVPESFVVSEKSQKNLSENKLDLKPANEPSKSSSNTTATGISKISITGYRRSLNTRGHSVDKEHGKDSNLSKDEDVHQVPRKISKEHSKYSVSSTSKSSSHSKKISHSFVTKKTSPDSRKPLPHTSTKSSSAPNAGDTISTESAGSLQKQRVLDVQNKSPLPGLPNKAEKVNNLSSGPQSTKVTQPVSSSIASKTPAALSDEELALLLHQELNSSPRVPRVPRMRHTGSLPHLTSPTGTSTLMKRTSSAGGKDQNFIPKRKGKDIAKDASQSSYGMDSEVKRMKRRPSYSPDRKKHDPVTNTDASARSLGDSGSGKGLHSNKKSTPPPVSTASISSGPASSAEINEQNVVSMHNSPHHASDDDVGGPVHHTLPGLLAEIMGKGQRMTYEELCDAVLPHWPNLRKHNGERYAYSSHSQAVLDCLRNRNEWSQLVDRGPKTNASRKRRKLDIDGQEVESEHGGGSNGKERTEEADSKSFDSRREEFPKGKRKARKRRRLALQGRGIKDIRRRRRVDMVSEDDNTRSPSSSTQESLSSEDDGSSASSGDAV
ncbi:uncharacterized protein LOC124919510 isoform X2 [Impatiens glandulifera]|uniref:uncharacterized protein LOC124919510 isoform X2 n=1 Tax=Impatiens glandulifera TaxID=253017 RepID=UPI001FB0A729|nr:uncharacterized protein LOC124919510 isoform X2 [Impatiens glandulifera]